MHKCSKCGVKQLGGLNDGLCNNCHPAIQSLIAGAVKANEFIPPDELEQPQMLTLKNIKTSEDLKKVIFDVLSGSSHCLDNDWECKIIAANITSELTGESATYDFTEEEAQDAAEYGYEEGEDDNTAN